MKKLFALAAIFVATVASGQDLMVLRDGTIRNVKVTEVSDTEIMYKDWNNQSGPVFVTSLGNVLSVKYQNGTVDTYARRVSSVAGSNSGFSVHVGGVFPTGDFADGATTGVDVGVKYIFPVADGLGVFLGADGIVNFSNSDAKDYVDYVAGLNGATTVERYPSCIQVPVMVGLNYRHDFDEHTALWAETGVGPNTRFFIGEKYSGGVDEAAVKYKPSVSFGFQVGAGVMLNGHFSVGVHYYGLGKADIEAKTQVNGDDLTGWEDGGYFKSSAFMVRLGYHF